MNNVKDIFLVEDTTNNPAKYRTSEAMIISAGSLMISTVITIIARAYDFELATNEVATLTTGLVGIVGSVVGLVLRWRSKGGMVKAKEETKWHESEDDDDWFEGGV